LALARRYREQGPEAWARYLFAACAAKFEPEEREEVLDGNPAALNLADELGVPALTAYCHLGMGQLHQRMGRDSKAKAGLSQPIDTYRQMDRQFYLKQAAAELQANH
jgi:hypothetical protein